MMTGSTRRVLLAGLGACLVRPHTAAAAPTWAADAASRLAEIERSVGGRLGVAVRDSGTGDTLVHRADERFPMCSTFKLLAAALVLARVDGGQERLDRSVSYSRADLVPYSPATEPHAGRDGMTVAALCEAALTLSDNTAANLLLASFGGPAGLTAFARAIGDPVTRLDRTEPTLNEATPGDPRDTTTPAAMAETLRRLLLGDALSSNGSEQLLRWLRGNKVGDKRLRAGLGNGWQIGDKTGSGAHGTTNDIGILWRPGRPPILLAVYLTETAADEEQRNGAIAAVARIVTGG